MKICHQCNIEYQDNIKFCPECGCKLDIVVLQKDSNITSELDLLYKKGKQLYDNGEYSSAVDYFLKAAQGGHKQAQFELGCFYNNGNGVEVDYAQSLYWLRRSAEQGHDVAQYFLGHSYTEGISMEIDYAQAVYWYKLSAEQGNANAQCDLGHCYYYGKGIEQNNHQAFFWWKKSAEQGCGIAQRTLGICYCNGYGVEKDFGQAVYWLRAASDNGDVIAQFQLARQYYEGLGIEKNYAEAVRWYTRAAERNHDIAQFELGCCYNNGLGVDRDMEKAVYWWKQAAIRGNSNAQYNFALCYSYGDIVNKDLQKAIYWLRQAAKQEHSLSQNQLGYNYEKGIGVEENKGKALYWYTKAAENGYKKFSVNTKFFTFLSPMQSLDSEDNDYLGIGPTEEEWLIIFDELKDSREIKKIVDVLRYYNESPKVFCKIFDNFILTYPQTLYFCKLIGWGLIDYGCLIDKKGNVYRETYKEWIVEANKANLFAEEIHAICDIVQKLSHYDNYTWINVFESTRSDVEVIEKGEITQIKIKSVRIVNEYCFVVISEDNKKYYPYSFPFDSLGRIEQIISVIPRAPLFGQKKATWNEKNKIRLFPEIALHEIDTFLNSIP